MPANFGGMISIFCDPTALSPSFGTWRELLNHEKVWGAFGIHPHNAKYYNDSVEQRIEECLKHPKAVAWGECGLDFFKNISPKDAQEEAFIKQVVKAVEVGKPIVIHSRNAEKETYDILKKFAPKDWPMHVHCFNDSKEQAIKLLKDFSKLYIGVTGAITFHNAGALCDCIKSVVPLERILLETDAPYMAPSPIKGICHSGYIPLIAEKLANLKGVSISDVFLSARENTKQMYGV